jgi:hypothetical protein
MIWVKVNRASISSLSSLCIDLNFTSNIGFRKLGNSSEKDWLDEETVWWRSGRGGGEGKAEEDATWLSYKYDITTSDIDLLDA